MLNGFQQKVAGAAILCVSVCAIGGFAIAALKIAGAFLDKFGAVVWPLALAVILSFILKPAVDFMAVRLKVGRTAACWIMLAVLALAAAGCLVAVLPALVSEIYALCASLPDFVARVSAWLSEHFPQLKDIIAEKSATLKEGALKNLSVSVALGYVGNFFKTAASATGGVVAFASFAAAFAVAPIYLYYMLTSRFDFFAFLENNIGFMSPKMKEDSMFFARRFASIMSAFFRGQMTIAFIMGILIGLGLTLVGVKFGFLLGFAAGMLNIIPYFGTIVGLGTILPTAFFQPGGGLLTAAFALCVFVAVQTLEGYFLTPKIMGGKTGLHPTVIIFSVFFWGIALDGILGMILAIPLTAFMAALWSRFLGGGERASSPE